MQFDQSHGFNSYADQYLSGHNLAHVWHVTSHRITDDYDVIPADRGGAGAHGW